MVDVNPKQAEGDRKVSMAAVPCGPLFKLGQVMQYGADKYGRHNFRTSGAILASTYYDAALRHLAAWWEGQALDPESRLEHLAHVMAAW